MDYKYTALTGLQRLNEHLKFRSYVDGHSPSQADAIAFDALESAQIDNKINSSTHPYMARWYYHIKSFGESRKEFPVCTCTEVMMPVVNDLETLTNALDNNIDMLTDDYDEFDFDKDNICGQKQKFHPKIIKADSNNQKKTTAKSLVILDVKPKDFQTDMIEVEESVRSLQMEGLLWGASQLVPVAFGINKLQILCVIENAKVSVDTLLEAIPEEFILLVQSVDVAAFNAV